MITHTRPTPGIRSVFRFDRLALACMLGGAALAADAGAQGPGVIEEITVTAQKREQSLQDVSAAVSHISGDELSVRNIDDPFDLSEQVPGLVATNVQGYRRTFAIRGIGNEVPDNAATKPGVAYHVDGVFMSNDFALFQDLVDVKRIEVTRGPDGTIFGNSSSGGAVNVVTHAPDPTRTEGFVSGTLGSYSTGNVRGSFNLPLGDTTAVRLSASHRSHDGFTENVPNPQSSPQNVPGEFDDLDDENNTSLNGQFLWDISDRLSARVSYQKFDQDINGPALKGGFDTVSDDPRTVSHDTDEFFEVDNEILGLILDGSTDFADMKALFSRQDYRMSRRLDADRSSLTANDPAPLPTPASGDISELGQLPIRQHVGGLTQEDETFTAEFNIASPTNGSRLSWQGGIFWLETEIDSNTRNFVDGDRDGEPVNTEVLGFGNPDLDFQNSDRREFESRAVFGQISYALTDQLNVTGGARWTRNEFEDERCNVFNGCLTNDGRTGTPATPSETNRNLTYKFVLDYALNDHSMVYGSVATGIKPAASNNGFVEDSEGTGFFPEVFEEEEVRAWEIGSKNLLWDQRLMVNVAAYFYEIDNYLFNSAGLSLTGNGVAGGSNLPTSEAWGIEIESSATLTDRLRLDVMLAAADSEITSSRLAVDRGEQVNRTASLSDPAEIEAVIRSIAEDVEGNELPKRPDLVANVRLSYDHLVDTGSVSGLLTSTLAYRYRGEYFNRVFNSEQRDLVPSYHLTDLNFRFVPDDSQWRFDLNVQNLFDKDEVSSLHTDAFFQGVTSFQLLPPRVITLQARYDF